MKIDRVVVTTFPGYFFITTLCLKSIKKYFPRTPITVIIDDFELDSWPSYVNDCQSYLLDQFPDLDFVLFSQLQRVDDANMGGWFRQQLIKLHLDLLVPDCEWLVVDGDLIFKDTPNLNVVPVFKSKSTPVDIGNRHYVKHMLGIDQPWLGESHDYLCASVVPFRYITKELLQSLRSWVERVHGINFLELHLNLMKSEDIVAFDSDCVKSVMSEFQLIEVFRQRCYSQSLPIKIGTSDFYHDSIKDWQRTTEWFESHEIAINNQLWSSVLEFGKNRV